MDDIEKIKKIVEIVSGSDVEFIIRRTEGVDNPDTFESLHKEFGVESKVTQISCRSSGKLELLRFVEFLKKYDHFFSLDPTIIEVGAVVINPILL